MAIYTIGDLHLSFNTNKPMDIFGKICPKYFVEDEAAWEQFKNNIRKALEE